VVTIGWGLRRMTFTPCFFFTTGALPACFSFGFSHPPINKARIISPGLIRFLPFEEAAFLSGLTLGGRSDFSKNFKEAMKKSGTTHLVALSGYNITIIAWAMANFFAFFFKRKKVFALTTMAIIGFVIMTGAEASVTRAAVMGMLILLASQVGRIYDVRNALMLAGLVMVLLNPKILTYDLGFQFSFLALMGIVYLKPAIQKFFNISEDTGFLSLKDHFLNTTAAQIADAVLDEALSGHETAGTTGAALGFLLNKWSFTTTTWTVYKSDGSTTFYTFTLAGDGTTTFTRTPD